MRRRGGNGARASALAGLLAIAAVSLPTPGWPQRHQDAAGLERKEKIEEGWQIVEMPELEGLKRRQFDSMSTDAEIGNELRWNETQNEQRRMGAKKFQLWGSGI